MTKKKKERIELQFDPEKDAELIKFIDENGATMAGFIKFVLNHYKNTLQDIKTTTKPEEKPTKKTSPSKPKKPTKKIPKLGQSFSSKDFDD